jgi:hypothetical protein
LIFLLSFFNFFSMSRPFKAVLFLALTALAALSSGCADDANASRNSPLPWGRPASWEGTMPGMGTQAPKY